MYLFLEYVGSLVADEVIPARVFITKLTGTFFKELLDEVVLVSGQIELRIHDLYLAKTYSCTHFVHLLAGFL